MNVYLTVFLMVALISSDVFCHGETRDKHRKRRHHRRTNSGHKTGPEDSDRRTHGYAAPSQSRFDRLSFDSALYRGESDSASFSRFASAGFGYPRGLSRLHSEEIQIREPGRPHRPQKLEAIVEGDLVLGGLMMVHERGETTTCGPVMPQVNNKIM